MYSQQKIRLISSEDIFNDVISTSKQILKEYDLCENCIGRLFAKKLGLSSHKFLGKKIKNQLKTKSSQKCYICKNILSHLDTYVEKMQDASSGYEFSTFLVGAILKPSLTDRDDVIRSKYRLKGIDSIKSDITHQIGKKFAKKAKAKIDYLYPDLTFTINFKNDSCELRAKPLFLYGRYTKNKRGLPQKQTPCNDCKGKGCLFCDHHGFSEFNSVEGKLAKFLYEKFGCRQTKITWIGGEDKTSLVLGKGRPFFAKLFDPKMRNVRLSKNYVKDEVTIRDLKPITRIPKKSLQFISEVNLLIQTENRIKSNELKQLKELKKTPILIHEKPKKETRKSVYEIKYRKNSPTSFLMWMTIDGGLPIKRLVEGGDISPNLSNLLGNRCACKKFDFHEIEMTY